MKKFCEYSNKDELLKDLASFEANILNKNPDLPKKEKILEIYRYIVYQFENQPINDPTAFMNDVIFKLALGINSETAEGLEKINKIINEEAYLTREQLLLCIAVVKSVITNPMMRSLDKNMENYPTYWMTAPKYAKWMLHNIYGIVPESDRRKDEYSWWWQWCRYCGVFLSIERNGNGDIDRALAFKREQK